MKRWVACFVAGCCAVLALVGLSACALSTPPLSEKTSQPRTAQVSSAALVEPDTLTVAVNTASAPMGMLDAGGNPSGYTADVARALASELGLSASVVNASPSDVADGTADVYLGAEADALPDDTVSTGSVFTEATGVFARTTGEAGAEVSAESLSGARIAVQDGSASQQQLERSNVTYTEMSCSNVNECLSALESGQVDYAVCNASAGGYLTRAYDDVALVGTLGAPSEVVAAVAAGNAELAEAVSGALSTLASNGVLDAVRTAWFGDLPTDLSGMEVAGVVISEESDDEDAALSSDAEGDEGTGAAGGSSADTDAAGTSSTGADGLDHSALNSTDTFF